MALPSFLIGKKPFSIVENKWFRMVIFPLCMLCTTVTYYGWQHFQMFLQDGDFLSYLCPAECLAGDPSLCPEAEQSVVASCRDQETAWTTGYTIASSMEAGGSLIAGILFDHLGPLGTAIFGQLMHYSSWVLIFNSGESSGLWYTGMCINGLSVNLTAFPAFILIDIFPEHKFIMTAVILGGQVSATIVMPILYTVNESVQVGGVAMVSWFLGVIALPISCLYLLSLPLSHKHLVNEYKRKGLEIAEKAKPDWKIFGKCIITIESIIFTCWYVVMIMQFNVFSSQLSEIAGNEIADVVGWMMFLQGPTAILFGWFNDMTKTIPMCFVLTLMQVYAFGMIWAGEAGGYFAGLMFVCANAHIYTTKFCYAAELFPAEHFGKVSGFFAVTAGALQFINTAVDALGAPVEVMMMVYMLLTLPQFLALGYLGYRQFRKGIDYLTIGQPAPVSGSMSKSGSLSKEGSVLKEAGDNSEIELSVSLTSSESDDGLAKENLEVITEKKSQPGITTTNSNMAVGLGDVMARSVPVNPTQRIEIRKTDV